MAENGRTELEINGMETTSSLPAKVDDLKDMQPIQAEVRNQKTGQFEMVAISPEDVRNYIAPTATLAELYVFMNICRHQGLDPISEAYFVKYGSEPGFTVMKYTVYLKRAMQSGVLKSIRHEFDDEENPTKITVYIERRDIEGEWAWTTYRSNVEQHRKSDGKVTAIWQKQLQFMMVKCGYSQGLRFFCADVVGALPPTQEEMGGIPALDMPSPANALPPIQSTIEGERVSGEVLEVKDVQPLPEHIDLTPMRNTYFGMIKGMFKDDPGRKAFQLKHFGVEFVKDFTLETYAKIWKFFSQQPDPDLPEGAKSIEEQTQEEVDKLEAEQATTSADDPEQKGNPVEPTGSKPEEAPGTFYAEAGKRFKDAPDLDSWCKGIISEKSHTTWTVKEFQKALPVLMEVPLLADQKGNEPTDPSASPTAEEVKEAEKFYDAEYEKMVAEKQSKKPKKNDDPKAEPGPKAELMREFLDILAETLPNFEERLNWVKVNLSPIEGIEDWAMSMFEKGIKMLNEYATQGVTDDPEPSKTQGEGEDAANDAKEPAGSDDGEGADEVFLITKATKLEISAALLKFPDKKYKTIRSLAFHNKSVSIIDHGYGHIDDILESDAQLILAALNRELVGDPDPVVVSEQVAGEIVDPDPLNQGPVPVTSKAPPMTDEQYVEMKEKVSYMPERFHQSMGSHEFRQFVSDVTERKYDGIRSLTEAEGTKVITKMDEAIKKETERQVRKAAAENAPTVV